jgi:hypothetical protein
MKRIALLALVLLSLNAFSQSEYNWNWDWDFDKTVYQPIKYTPPKGLNSVVFTSVNKKGKVKKYKKTYNSQGNLIAYFEQDKKETFIPVVKYTYDNQNLIKSSKSYKKGKLESTVVKTRLAKGKPLEVMKTNSKNELVSHSTWKYNDNDCVVSSNRYKKGDKLYLTWDYEYRGDCEKSRTTLKKKSGKIVQIWSYDCKEEGEVLEKRKDEVQVCKWDETSKDFLIRVNESFNEKGEVRKTVRKFTLADTLIVESSTYDVEGRLVWHSTYDKDYNRPLKVEYFKKGKTWFANTYEYTNENLTAHEYAKRGKRRSKFIYTYDNDRLVERKSFNDKDEVKSTISLAYS